MHYFLILRPSANKKYDKYTRLIAFHFFIFFHILSIHEKPRLIFRIILLIVLTSQNQLKQKPSINDSYVHIHSFSAIVDSPQVIIELYQYKKEKYLYNINIKEIKKN